jgi:uncharacterized protein DUF397
MRRTGHGLISGTGAGRRLCLSTISADGIHVTRGEQMNATWAKSSFSFSNGNCVEVAGLPGGSVGIRDSRDPGGPVLRFTRGAWGAFLGGARHGEFAGPHSVTPPGGRMLDGTPGQRGRGALSPTASPRHPPRSFSRGGRQDYALRWAAVRSGRIRRIPRS